MRDTDSYLLRNHARFKTSSGVDGPRVRIIPAELTRSWDDSAVRGVTGRAAMPEMVSCRCLFAECPFTTLLRSAVGFVQMPTYYWLGYLSALKGVRVLYCVSAVLRVTFRSSRLTFSLVV
jgi:hypothetical protein